MVAAEAHRQSTINEAAGGKQPAEEGGQPTMLEARALLGSHQGAGHAELFMNAIMIFLHFPTVFFYFSLFPLFRNDRIDPFFQHFLHFPTRDM